MILDIEKHTFGDVTLIKTKKRLDAEVSDIYKQKIKKLIDQGKLNIVLDMSETEFIDSSGLACMVSRILEIRSKGGDLRLSLAGAEVKNILELTNLNMIFKSYPNSEDAINSFST